MPEHKGTVTAYTESAQARDRKLNSSWDDGSQDKISLLAKKLLLVDFFLKRVSRNYNPATWLL